MANSVAAYSKRVFGQIQNALGITTLVAENDQKLQFRDPLERKSKVSQKLCCHKLCEVAVLKELVDGTLKRDFTKVTHASVWG